jgi:hypothetical protein
MNESNALNQLKLCETTSRLRREQFTELGVALLAYSSSQQEPVKRAITFSNTAMLLIQTAHQLEDLIVREIDQAKSNMKKMQELPDAEQWEYRIAHTLGMTEGLNKIGSLLNQMREHTQSALHKASMLALTADGKSALPAHQPGQSDNLHAIEEEANTRQNKRLKEICRLGLTMAQAFAKDAQEHENSQPLTIASISSNSCDLTTSSLLVALGNLATEILSSNVVVKDEIKEQWQTAQATAAGIIGGLIAELVQKNEPWLAVSLN